MGGKKEDGESKKEREIIKETEWKKYVDVRVKGVWGSGCIDTHFLDLGNNWR
jgi:hypothetical protein